VYNDDGGRRIIWKGTPTKASHVRRIWLLIDVHLEDAGARAPTVGGGRPPTSVVSLYRNLLVVLHPVKMYDQFAT
jgi:hypothetical protein